jgi:RNA polymerase sigma-70 factor, ECF subfamily
MADEAGPSSALSPLPDGDSKTVSTLDLNDERSEEFAQLLARCERQLYAYILALVWSRHDAEDLYQQTAMTLWTKFDEFERGTDFPRWAFSVARLLVANFQRAKRRHGTFLTSELASILADRQAAMPVKRTDGLSDALVGCMERLGDADRRLIDLSYGADMSIKQVAEQIGRPVQSTYNSLSRIRRWLFDCIRRASSRGADA